LKQLNELAKRLREVKDASGLSVREISRRMGIPGQQAQVQRIICVAPTSNITLRTLFRFIKACGFEVEIVFRRRT
jgi:transcriptional regulator with XRE-family HTH domain